MEPSISAVILTLNEERNLAKALGSVSKWVNEIVVVDMNSDDKTVEIARQFGARVFQHPRVGLQDPARAFAMEKATGEWIINLDADEIAPYALSRRLLEIAERNLADVCTIPRLNYFSGAPMYHSGWNPNEDRQVRFFRKGFLEFSPDIHALPRPTRGARVLPLQFGQGHYILHFNFLDSEQYLDKFNRYTGIEAEQAQIKGIRSSLAGFVVAPMKEFAVRFFVKAGFRDGWRGLYYCALMGAYRMTIAAKLRERELGFCGEQSREFYDEIAAKYLREYPSDPSSIVGQNLPDRWKHST